MADIARGFRGGGQQHPMPNYPPSARYRNGPSGSNGGASSESVDATLLRQVLSRLDGLDGKVDELGEAVSKGATRDDLKTLVQRDTYDIQRAADLQGYSNNTARITSVEQAIGALKDQIHAIQLADAMQFGAVRTEVGQGVSQAMQSAGTSQQTNASRSIDQWRTAFMVVVGIATTLFGALLSYVIFHH